MEFRRKNSIVFEEVLICNIFVLIYNDKYCLDVVCLLVDDVCCLVGYIFIVVYVYMGIFVLDVVCCLELGIN